MEQLQGRFHALFKAEDGERLLAARQRLLDTERDLARIQILPLDEAAAAEFERLLGTKGLRRIGRGDLLIVSIVLANKATLVTRNVKDFEKVPGLKMENWVD
jgi:tRNA(fMet)-specific endonuclease VapC